MLALLWTVVGIGLSGLLIYGGLSYFQGTGPERMRIKEAATSSFYGLASAYQAYVNSNNASPASGSWNTQLIPTYLTELKYPLYPTSGFTWSFNTDATYGDYFCLSGSMTSVQCNGMADASSKFPVNSYVVNATSCSTRTAVTCASIGSWPATVYVTYWLRGA